MILRTRYPFRAAKSFLLIPRRCMTAEAVSVNAPTRYFQHGFTIPSARTFSTQEQATISNHPKSPKISYPHLGTGYRVGWQWKLVKQVDKNGQPKANIVISFKGVGDNTEGFIVPSFWLRDNCRCKKCVNQDTMQRAFDTFLIPETIAPIKVVAKEEGLKVTWSDDGHVSLYPWEWLWRHRSPKFANAHDTQRYMTQSQGGLILWDASIKNQVPSVHYDKIMNDDEGVGEWTTKIRRYGFCYVDGCPVSPEKTEKLLQRIAFIRETHYGGFYDFTSDLMMKDTAYTSLALGPHTDTTYFTDPAGLQMFHLLSHESGSGGQSLLIDGFKAARILEEESKEAYDILASFPISWHASGNQGTTITPAEDYPVLKLTSKKDRNFWGSVMQVRWNNDDRGVLQVRGNDRDRIRFAEKWYPAARKWDEILKRETLQYWAQLEPGRPVIFDNWRVLHGRSAFTGKRRICGGYINHDDFISRWRNTNFTREEVLQQIL